MTPQERLRQRITALLNLEPGNVSSGIILRTLVRECEAAGWKIVPVELTAEMNAAFGRPNVEIPLGNGTSFSVYGLSHTADIVWERLLEAAPKVIE